MEGINSKIKFEGKMVLDDSALQQAMSGSSDRFANEAAALKKIFIDNQHKSSKEIIKALESHMADLGRPTEQGGLGDPKMLKDLMKLMEELKGIIAGGGK